MFLSVPSGTVNPTYFKYSGGSDLVDKFDGNHEIAVTDISYPRTWKTVDDSKCYLRKMFRVTENDSLIFDIPGDHIRTYDELVLHVNSVIQKKFTEYEPEDSKCPRVNYDREKNIFTLESGFGKKSNFYTVEFTDDLKILFGFEEYGDTDIDLSNFDDFISPEQLVTYYGTKIRWDAVPKDYQSKQYIPEIEEAVWKRKRQRIDELSLKYKQFKELDELFLSPGKYNMSLTKSFKFYSTLSKMIPQKYSTMHVFCSMIKVNPQTIYNELVRVIHLDNYEFEEQVDSNVFANEIYFPVQSVFSNDIEIKIKDRYGKWFPFNGGEVRIGLNIRKRQ